MKWFLRALLTAYFLCIGALCAQISAAENKPVRWVTDKPFARSVYQAVKDKYPSMMIVCKRPDLPPRSAVTLGVPQEDCLIIAASKTRFFCGEFAYDNGPLPPQEFSCTLVAESFQKDVRPGDILKFTTRARAPEA